jgi:thiamine pyrophosphate-dependent acetolactate synthase large subunit-like protein
LTFRPYTQPDSQTHSGIFAGSGTVQPPQARDVVSLSARASRIVAAAESLAKAQRPLLVIGSQSLALADDSSRIAAAISRLGVPVYLSGMARGLLERDHPLQMLERRMCRPQSRRKSQGTSASTTQSDSRSASRR